MTPAKYLELCRLFIAEHFRLSLRSVKTLTIDNPCRWKKLPYRHHIDLCWTTSNRLLRYIHIARVSWRKARPVHGAEILLLQKVKECVAAHRAFFITNTKYTEQALRMGRHERITLLLLHPPGMDPKYGCRCSPEPCQKRRAARGHKPVVYTYRIIHPMNAYDKFWNWPDHDGWAD
jgi:hypothetical protein